MANDLRLYIPREEDGWFYVKILSDPATMSYNAPWFPPDGFYISTPVGHYNPDWAIAFYEGKVKHIYFVAETKGSMSSMQLRLIEESKIHCAREHFKAISNGNVVYDVVDSYKSLLEKVMK